MKNETIVDGITYATNDLDEGLFYWGKPNGGIDKQWIQITGTCDFSVKNIKYDKNKKAKIRRAVKYVWRES